LGSLLEIIDDGQDIRQLGEIRRRSTRTDIDSNVQFPMPQASPTTPWAFSPPKSQAEQLGDQRARFQRVQVEIGRRPQSTSVKLDRRAPVQNRIRHTKRLARRRLPDQLQRVDKASSPKRSTDYVPHSVSLHMQRIACESPICENQEKSSCANTDRPLRQPCARSLQLKTMEEGLQLDARTAATLSCVPDRCGRSIFRTCLRRLIKVRSCENIEYDRPRVRNFSYDCPINRTRRVCHTDHRGYGLVQYFAHLRRRGGSQNHHLDRLLSLTFSGPRWQLCST
jgi:hypothetical protein